MTRLRISDTAWDLIGQHGLTQVHYDLMTGPWRQAIGRAHPDDTPLTAPSNHKH